MPSPSARPYNAGWVVAAHIGAGIALGALEGGRLGNVRITLVLAPLFAVTGLFAGLTIVGCERVAARWPAWIGDLVVAAPTLVVTLPVFATLFDGAYAQTLPLAGQLPYLAPLVVWLVVALARGAGRRIASDLAGRAIVILVCAGAIGGIVWVERHVLGSGYRSAHIGATLALVVLAGCALRLALRVQVHRVALAALATLVIGTATAAISEGLALESDRRQLAAVGEHGRDMVALWRMLLDIDRDGSSAVLGGGDCDDRDASRHPGALDTPGDGLDQDCDGSDATAARGGDQPTAVDVATWRARPEVAALLARTRNMNILLVTVDALRFDLLAPGASHRDEFPTITQLLDRSVWFTRAIAPASGTDVALSTLLSGRLDPFQRVALTLPEAVRALGRRTTTVLPAEVLRHVGEVMVHRGFDRQRKLYTDWDYNDIGDHVSSPALVEEARLAFDDAGARSWLVWLHFFDVHEHHQIAVPSELMRAVSDGGSPVVHRYRALLLAVDRALARVLEQLERRNLADKTIIVFASDHGESLREDPRLLDTHGFVAYAPLVRIPIAIHVPGVPGGLRTDPVSLVDIAPTVLALLGAPQAHQSLDGFDLVPALLDGPIALRPPANRALVIHEEQQWSVVEWPYQLLVKPADDLVELYDLDRDPALATDLAAREPALVKRLRDRYGETPVVHIDRTPDGRSWREQQARAP